MTEKKSKHHHGNLRSALIDAGIAILSADGLDKLTLRKCAAMAGVSHAAPAHHFDGLPGLNRAIIEEGFRIFRNYMLDMRNLAGDNPRDRLRAICRGYLYFAIDNPALFELMFGIQAMRNMGTSPPDSPGTAYHVLHETCLPFVPAETDPQVIAAQVWSLIHGFCTLFLSQQLGDIDSASVDLTRFNQVLALLDTLPLADQP